MCEEYAKNNDILILHTYIDRAMTGTNDNRPDFQRMIKDSFRKEWNYVIVYKLDRFSRNKYETAIHKKTLKDNGVKVMSATEYIPDTPEAIIFESMLEGYAEYYSAELSQKIRRGNNESRRKGNLTGGTIPFGYKNVNKKAVIVEDEAEVVRYIFEQYAHGEYVKNIVKELNARGITHKGKCFINNTVYNILKNERYAGIYHHNGEVFDNIYPRIVPQNIFEIVREKGIRNKLGSNSVAVDYLLRNKVKCGYCGESVIGECGTSKNGTRMYYYKCRGRKERLNNCEKQAVRKDVLENCVIDSIVKALSNNKTIETIVRGIMEEQERTRQNNPMLDMLTKEKRATETAIDNIMKAIEKGVVTNTTTKRLKQLEEKQEELERQIILERSNIAPEITQSDVRKYLRDAIQQSAKVMIELLIDKIILFDDRVEIYFKQIGKNSPDRERGFSFYTRTIDIKYKTYYGNKTERLHLDIEMYI